MANEPIVSNLGGVSAYLDAVAHGFSGTREEFGELLANGAAYYQRAETAAQHAEQDASAAVNAANAAVQSAQVATDAAGTASTASQSASTDAAAASTAAGIAATAAESASGSASAAATSANNAGTYATNADLSAQEAAATLASAEAAIEAKGAAVEAEVDGYIADAQAAINTLEAQKDTIAQTVASMAQLGTDTTLSTTGMAADAKATGDALAAQSSEIDDVEAAINYAPQTILLDKSVDTNTSDPILPSAIKSETWWCCLCVPCVEGDVFTVTGTGGSTSRLWAFSASDGTRISQANSGTVATDLKVVAPENAAYFAYNSRYMNNQGVTYAHNVYKGNKPTEKFAEIESELGSVIDDADKTLYMELTDEIGTAMTWTSGYITAGGITRSSDSYHYSEPIEVSEGDVISALFMRFITAYVGNTAVESLGAENKVEYTVPKTVTSVVVSMVTSETTVYHKYKERFDGLADHVKAIEEKIDGVTFDNDTTVVSATADSLTNGESLVACSHIDCKKGDTIFFYANVNSNAFGSVTVGHGYNINYGASVTVDATKATITYGTVADDYHVNHGLTIDKFLMIEVVHADNAHAEIRISTASGMFTIASSPVHWGGSKGDVFALSTNSTLTDVKLSCNFADFERDIFLFGDSYVGLGDSARYPYYLIQNGYNNLMIDGWGGRGSTSAITSFRNVIAMAKPKYLIWALGMNDSDSVSAINASYKTCLDEVIATCESYGVTPILATIPNIPERLHTFKNAYVKSLGKRYIDFAKAVGAEEAGSTWWSGMLGSDDTHPTALGAQALYARFLIDVPEIADLP